MNNLALPLDAGNTPTILLQEKSVEKVIIVGLKNIPEETVLRRISLKRNAKLDAKTVKNIISNIFNLGYFSDINLYYELSDSGKIILYIVLKEKEKVAEFVFHGNDSLSHDTIEKKIFLSKITWVDQANMKMICKKIQSMYAEKQYHKASITYIFEPSENGSIRVHITVNEGVKSRVRSIQFMGNKYISRHQLKEIIATREFWLLGFLDRGGIFRKEMVDYDRYQIENFYQSNGFFEAKVTSVNLDQNEQGIVDIVYRITEGPLYYVGNVIFQENELFDKFYIERMINIRSGEVYSKEKVKYAISSIKNYLGECGFMYATITPRQKINKDTNTIDIEFVIECGKPVYVRNISIKGNKKTREMVVRREIPFSEGEVLTTRKLFDAKRAIDSLGYFAPQTGVAWDIHNVAVDIVDLDLLLQEAKTGRFYLNCGINSGSDAGRSLQSVEQARWYDTLLTTSKIGFTLQDTNFKGLGLRYFLDASYARQDKSLSFGIADNWFLDWPISMGLNGTFRTVRYEDFHQTVMVPNERNTGGNFQLGFRSHVLNMVLFGLGVGIDNIHYTDPIIPRLQFPDNPLYQLAFSEIVRRSFQEGAVTWGTLSISDDKRNNPNFPTEGYQWVFDTKIAFPNTLNSHTPTTFGFVKIGLDARWYTPLIMQYNVVFHMHGYAGAVYQMPGHSVPYKELFHVGGPQSVRGFLYGQIGPQLLGSSIGATKAFFINTEIQCPINKAATMTGVVFYDGGAAWNTVINPCVQQPSEQLFLADIFQTSLPDTLITNNNINYRHSVGIGLRFTSPMPIKVDWGFKLDRNKKAGEPLYEVHISMQGSY